MLSDPFLGATILLLLSTICAAILYYRRIKGVQEEYTTAKEVIGEIIISFNRQFENQEKKVGFIGRKTETLVAKNHNIENRLESIEKNTRARTIKMISEVEQKTTKWFKELDKKLEEVNIVKETIKGIEIDSRRAPQVKPHIETVIPIKKEEVLAPLTETELRVLEVLVNEGSKTAPEIRDKIQLMDNIKNNPPRPGEMKQTIAEGVYEIDLDALLAAQINDCPATVIPMLIDHGVRTAVDIKQTYKPEKRILDFQYWWVIFLAIGLLGALWIGLSMLGVF